MKKKLCPICGEKIVLTESYCKIRRTIAEKYGAKSVIGTCGDAFYSLRSKDGKREYWKASLN